MLPSKRRKILDACVVWGQFVVGVIGAAFGGLLKADPKQVVDFPLLFRAVTWLQGIAWIVVIAVPILLLLLEQAKKKWGGSWAWDAIQDVIDRFREAVFDERNGNEPTDHHRVTLFRRCGGELKAVARSGHLSKESILRFRVSDDGDSCEGVVGQAWRRPGWHLVPPPGETLPEPNNWKERDEYAKATGVSVKWLAKQQRQGKTMARSFAALAVRVKGEPWGVLVLDSRDTRSFDPEVLNTYDVYASLLAPMLERV